MIPTSSFIGSGLIQCWHSKVGILGLGLHLLIGLVLSCAATWAQANTQANTSSSSPTRTSTNTTTRTTTKAPQVTVNTAPNKEALIQLSIKPLHPLVGQQVIINVDILVDGYFNEATHLNLPSVKKGPLRRLSSTAINGTTTYEGKSYTSQRWQLSFYPDQQGLVELPPIFAQVHFRNAQDQQRELTLSTPSKLLLAQVIPGTEGLMVSSDVTIDAQWHIELDQPLPLGAIISRNVSITAKDLLAVQIPSFKPRAIAGVTIHAHEARLNDRNNRGEQIGQLSQTFDYRFNEGGSFTLAGEHYRSISPKGEIETHTFDSKPVLVDGLANTVKYGIIATLAILATFILCSLFKLRTKRV